LSDAPYIIVGRSGDCDVVLADATVSGRHARLSWNGRRIVVEDLGSANGTFVGRDRVDRAEIRPGDDVRFGRTPIPWSQPRVRAFLRQGARGDTIHGVSLPGRRFICGACGGRGVMPEGFKGGELRCGVCRTRLQIGPPKRRRKPLLLAVAATAAMVVGVTLWGLRSGSEQSVLLRAAAELGIPQAEGSAASPQETSIRAHVAPRVLESIEVSKDTRNLAARVAADDQGPYKVEQVARLWSHVRERWRYVNDPRGTEYFASATETIANDFAGDCDDFAILLVSLIRSIGGEARLVMMDGPRGGHAYAEACVEQSPDVVRERLSNHYRRLRTGEVKSIHYRPSETCDVWLNLDWNAGVPGGPYEPESWAVAVYGDGQTETLAPAAQPTGPEGDPASALRASSPPR
jgi:hypothetical protein